MVVGDEDPAQGLALLPSVLPEVNFLLTSPEQGRTTALQTSTSFIYLLHFPRISHLLA